MRIGKPTLLTEGNEIFVTATVERGAGIENIWYKVDREYKDLVSESSDAFLVALLIPAMLSGETIHLDGNVSEKLFYHLSGRFQPLLQNILPKLKCIEIIPGQISTTNNSTSKGVATGFSGGVDSYAVLADHHYGSTPDGYKLTHLLFNNVGSHGAGGDSLFTERFKRLQPAAEHLGLPLIKVDSNISGFYEKSIGFKQTHTMRNASVALLLQKGIGKFMYASGHSMENTFLGQVDDMAYSDLLALPMLSTERIDCFSVGGEYTRVMKTLKVAEIDDAMTNLDVCVNSKNTTHFPNCGSCKKCLRTLATLDISGKLKRFSDIFDIDAYQAKRVQYLLDIQNSLDPLKKEIVELANQVGYNLPKKTKGNRAGRLIRKIGLMRQ